LLESQQRSSADMEEEVSLGDFVEYANTLCGKVAAVVAPERRPSADGATTTTTTIINATESPKRKAMKRGSSRRSLTRKGSKRSVDLAEPAVDQPVKRAQSFDNIYVVAQTSKSSSATTAPTPTHKYLLNESSDDLKTSRRHSTHLPRSMNDTPPCKENRRHSTHVPRSTDDTPTSSSSPSPPGSNSKKQHLRKRRSSRLLTKSASVSTLDKLEAEGTIASPVIARLPPPRQDSRTSLKKKQSFRSNKDDSPNPRPTPQRQASRSSLKKKTSSKSCNEESPTSRPLQRQPSSRSTLRDSLKTKLSSSSSPSKNEGSPKALPRRQNSRSSMNTWTNGEQRPASKQLRRSMSSSTLKRKEAFRSSSNSKERTQLSPKMEKLQRRHSAWNLRTNEDAEISESTLNKTPSSRGLKKKSSCRSMGDKLPRSSGMEGNTVSDLKAPMLRRKSSRSSSSRKESNPSLLLEEDTSAPPLQRHSSLPAMKEVPSCGSLGYETKQQEEEETPASPTGMEPTCRGSSLNNVEPKAKPSAGMRRRHSIHAPAITSSPTDSHCVDAAAASTRSLGDSQPHSSALVRCKSASELTESKNEASVPVSGGDGSGKNQSAEEAWAARILAEQERVEAQKRKTIQEWEAYILAEQKKAEERLAAEATAKEKAAAEWEAHIAAELKKAEKAKKRAAEEWEAHILAEQKKAEERLAMEAEAKKKAAEEWEAYILAEQKKAQERIAVEEQNKKRTAKEWTAKLLAEEKKALELRAAQEEAKRKAKALSSVRLGAAEAEVAKEGPETASVPAALGEEKLEAEAKEQWMAVAEERPAIQEQGKKRTAKEWTAKFLADKRKALEVRAAQEEAKRKAKALSAIRLGGVKAEATKELPQAVLVPAVFGEEKPEAKVEEELMAVGSDPSAVGTKEAPSEVKQAEADPAETADEQASTCVATHDLSSPLKESSKETRVSEERLMEQTLIAWKTAKRASRSKYLGLHLQVNKLSKRKLVLPTESGLPAEDKTQRSTHTAMSDATPRVSNREEALRTPKADNRQKESVVAVPKDLVLLTEDMSHASKFSQETPRTDNSCNPGENLVTPKTHNRTYPSEHLDLHSQVNLLAGSETTRPTKEKNELLASASKASVEEINSKTPKKDNRTSSSRNSLGCKRTSTSKVGDVPPSVVHRSMSPRDSNSEKIGMTGELQEVKLPLVDSEESPTGKDKLSEVRNALSQAQHFYKNKIQEKRRPSLCSRSSISEEPITVEDEECVVLDPDDSSVGSSSSSSSSGSSSSSSSSSSEESEEVTSKKTKMRGSLVHAGPLSRDALEINYGRQEELIKAARRKTQLVLAATGASSVRRASHQPSSKSQM
jgi:hypothetical protein